MRRHHGQSRPEASRAGERIVPHLVTAGAVRRSTRLVRRGRRQRVRPRNPGCALRAYPGYGDWAMSWARTARVSPTIDRRLHCRAHSLRCRQRRGCAHACRTPRSGRLARLQSIGTGRCIANFQRHGDSSTLVARPDSAGSQGGHMGSRVLPDWSMCGLRVSASLAYTIVGSLRAERDACGCLGRKRPRAGSEPLRHRGAGVG
jgi:hypothetical protein